MNKHIYNLLLADDDEDDCDFFKEALEDISLETTVKMVHDGVQLMEYLKTDSLVNLPDIVFLDVNMPRKNGHECLKEIRTIDALKNLPVIIISTSLDCGIVDIMYEKGANYYIRKPGDFSKLKNVIEKALITASENNFQRPSRANFILQP
ncbi:response regulator [Flavobacterium reichenbachii]|uniref:Transcriptional regulator n=1 Tax=Flavobacterium reichenbachii TaxID=362418 RepID=A0A085ZID5_9FLAO|nr:response regulator [Flavobacterium reichenbachii]KFF04199.1 transcriptional regulator [Flavobacterium reichenbachii]OXB13901.1 response regulator [Flavobacterium reichenbachii]